MRMPHDAQLLLCETYFPIASKTIAAVMAEIEEDLTHCTPHPTDAIGLHDNWRVLCDMHSGCGSNLRQYLTHVLKQHIRCHHAQEHSVHTSTYMLVCERVLFSWVK